jgi:hypothetical protein
MEVLVQCFKDDSRLSRSAILDKCSAQWSGESGSEGTLGIRQPAIFIGNGLRTIAGISTSKLSWTRKKNDNFKHKMSRIHKSSYKIFTRNNYGQDSRESVLITAKETT